MAGTPHYLGCSDFVSFLKKLNCFVLEQANKRPIFKNIFPCYDSKLADFAMFPKTSYKTPTNV